MQRDRSVTAITYPRNKFKNQHDRQKNDQICWKILPANLEHRPLETAFLSLRAISSQRPRKND